jgi:predicted DNA-binding transcriptional regulator AlpA
MTNQDMFSNLPLIPLHSRSKANASSRPENSKASRSQSERLLSMREVIQITGLSRSTLERRIRNDTFPPKVQLGPSGSRIAFRERHVLDWLEDPQGWETF